MLPRVPLLESQGAETLGEGNLSAATPGSPGPEEEGRAMAVVPSVPSLPGQARGRTKRVFFEKL